MCGRRVRCHWVCLDSGQPNRYRLSGKANLSAFSLVMDATTAVSSPDILDHGRLLVHC